MTTEARGAPRINRALDAAASGFLIAGVVIIPLLFWPWSADVFVGPKFDVLRVLTAGGVVAAAVRLAVERPKLRWRMPDACVVAFLVLNSVAYGFSVDRQTSLLGETMLQTGLVAVLAFAGAYAIARSSVRNLASTRTVFVAVSASASITALFGLAQLAGIDPVWSEIPQGRVFSTLGQPNWLAAYLVLAIPLTVALTITSTRRLARLGWTGAAVLQTAVLVSTLSRSGYAGITLACVVGIVLAAIVGSQISRHRNALVIAAAMLLSAVAIVSLLGARSPSVAPENIAHRAFSAFDVQAFESQQYISLWKVGLAIAIDHPLTGAGQSTYAIMFPQYRDEILNEGIADYLSNFRPESAHNVYVSIAAAAGFPALAAYATLIVACFTSILLAIRRGRRDSFLLVGLAAAIAGHVVTDAFMTIDLAGAWLFWALMGTGVAVADGVSDTNSENPQRGSMRRSDHAASNPELNSG